MSCHLQHFTFLYIFADGGIQLLVRFDHLRCSIVCFLHSGHIRQNGCEWSVYILYGTNIIIITDIWISRMMRWNRLFWNWTEMNYQSKTRGTIRFYWLTRKIRWFWALVVCKQYQSIWQHSTRYVYMSSWKNGSMLKYIDYGIFACLHR